MAKSSVETGQEDVLSCVLYGMSRYEYCSTGHAVYLSLFSFFDVVLLPSSSGAEGVSDPTPSRSISSQHTPFDPPLSLLSVVSSVGLAPDIHSCGVTPSSAQGPAWFLDCFCFSDIVSCAVDYTQYPNRLPLRRAGSKRSSLDTKPASLLW
ncbi:unnamed protein product [Ectocarpus sp. 12 AP-2014]